jgi:hypothetical protein
MSRSAINQYSIDMNFTESPYPYSSYQSTIPSVSEAPATPFVSNTPSPVQSYLNSLATSSRPSIIIPSSIIPNKSVTPSSSPSTPSYSAVESIASSEHSFILLDDEESIQSSIPSSSDTPIRHFSHVDSMLLPLASTPSFKRKRERTDTADIVAMAVAEMEARIIKRQRHRAGFVSGLIFSASVYAANATL